MYKNFINVKNFQTIYEKKKRITTKNESSNE